VRRVLQIGVGGLVMKRTLFFSLLLVCLVLIRCGGHSDNTTTGGNQPQITGMTPNVVNPGVVNVQGHILGTNLTGIISVSLGPGVGIQQFTTVSQSDIYVFFSVANDATPGARTISVNTTRGTFSSSSAFSVGDNRAPVARFFFAPHTLFRDTNLRFDASASSDPDGNINNYFWQFGDNRSATGRVVNHKFNSTGKFQVTLTVTDNRNTSAQTTQLLVLTASRAPAAQFKAQPLIGNEDTTFHFDGTPSRDPDGRIVRYSWGFGDGSSGTGANVDHVFNRTGAVPVTLNVTDDSGLSNFNTKVVLVKENEPPPPPPPGGGGGGPATACKGGCEGFNHLQSFVITDVNGDTITLSTDICVCTAGCGEVRRPGVNGLAEFLGDAVIQDSRTITLNHAVISHYTPPKTGENAYLVFIPCQ